MSTIGLFQPSFTSGEWSPSLSARVDLSKYQTALKLCKNFIVHAHGGVSNRFGTEFVAETKYSDKATRLIPFQFSVVQSYVLEFGDKYMRVIMDGGLVEDGEGDVYEIETPYAAEDVGGLNYTQSADVLYITHRKYAPMKLSRTGHAAWTLSSITFGASQAAPTNMARSSGSGSGNSYKVTAVNSEGVESLATSSVSGGPGDTFTWTAPATGTIQYYNVYKDGYSSGIFGWIGQALNTSFTEPSGGITPDYDTCPQTSKTVFGSATNYPDVCTFFQQRLVFARTDTKPQTLWGSRIGDFENQNVSSPLRDDDAYTFTINALQVNEIKWLVPLSELIIGTAGTEWVMSGASSGAAVTPTSVQLQVQSKWGSSSLPALVVGSTVLFVQAAGNVVRDLVYSLELDGYTGNNLSIFAEHLFENRSIVDWCFQQNPYSVVWAVRDDGVLLGMTYAREHEVWGWHQHETDGLFEAVASIQTGTAFDEVYVVVNRTIDGSTKRYIERFKDRLPDDDITKAFFVDCGMQYDGWNTDATLSMTLSGGSTWAIGESVTLTATGHTPFSSASVGTYYQLEGADGSRVKAVVTGYTSSSVVTVQPMDYNVPAALRSTATTAWADMAQTLSGLGHLEGEEVVALADGNVCRNLTVENGAVTLEAAAARISIGLPFTSSIETLELNVPDNAQLQDKKRQIAELTIRLRNSRAFWAGPGMANSAEQESRMEEMRFRRMENYSDPIALFTGDKTMSITAGDDLNSAKLFIENVDPVPLTILAIMPKVAYGEF